MGGEVEHLATGQRDRCDLGAAGVDEVRVVGLRPVMEPQPGQPPPLVGDEVHEGVGVEAHVGGTDHLRRSGYRHHRHLGPRVDLVERCRDVAQDHHGFGVHCHRCHQPLFHDRGRLAALLLGGEQRPRRPHPDACRPEGRIVLAPAHLEQITEHHGIRMGRGSGRIDQVAP